MSTIKANDIQNASGGIPTVKGQRLIPKTWVNFKGTEAEAIRDSENVSSLTDVGVGKYTVNFTTAMTNVNYSASGSCGANTGTSGAATVCIRPYLWATSSLSFTTNFATASQNADFDFETVNLTILGGQA
tara:strand:+ start:108 stop:497 length:390 start_codon:yes stop_codon:yes gene_type:complete